WCGFQRICRLVSPPRLSSGTQVSPKLHLLIGTDSRRKAMRAQRQVVEDYFSAVRAHDFGALSDMRHDDFVQEWHQMGERTRGKQNAQLINKNHPGLPKPTIRRIHEGPGFCVAETTLEYTDGSVWQ